MGKKEYDKAIADYDAAIKLKPNYALAYRRTAPRPGIQGSLRQGDRRL